MVWCTGFILKIRNREIHFEFRAVFHSFLGRFGNMQISTRTVLFQLKVVRRQNHTPQLAEKEEEFWLLYKFKARSFVKLSRFRLQIESFVCKNVCTIVNIATIGLNRTNIFQVKCVNKFDKLVKLKVNQTK